MESFISFYRDPMFSIIIILAIIVLVAIADYTRNRFKTRAKNLSLNALAKNFEYFGFDENVENIMNMSNYPISTLIFIANIYVLNGNFQEAIKIYLTILDRTKDFKEKIQILELLGLAYYKAGFMQRAKNIFIEILKHYPHNPKVLSLLMQTCEILGEYKNAYDVISCLEELDSENLNDTKIYIQILMLINDSIMPLKEREAEILRLNKESGIATKLVLNYLKSYNIELFWELIMNSSDVKNYIDILWSITNPPLHLIQNNKQIADVYRAKGLIDDNVECSMFELDCIRLLRKHSHKVGTLGFKYRCGYCQGIFPFESHRCPNCGELGNINLVLEVVEATFEKSYSLL